MDVAPGGYAWTIVSPPFIPQQGVLAISETRWHLLTLSLQPASPGTLVLAGDAGVLGNGIRLTAAQAWSRGAAWTATPRAVRDGFVASVSFSITDAGGVSDISGKTGADGLAFVIQSESGSPLGFAGEEQGYGGITRSLAIEFDTWKNIGDPDGNHISVQSRGVSANSSLHQYSLGFALAPVDLSDGVVHAVRVEYIPGLLNVYLDGALALSVAVDLTNIGGVSILDSAGNAWLGFTAATGAAYENHDLLSWTLP